MTVQITKPGFYADVPANDYFADPLPAPSLTQSIAKVLIERSPAHAKIEHPRLTPPSAEDDAEKYDQARAIGNAAHSLLLGRGKDIAIGPFDSWRSDKAKTFRAGAELKGQTVILEKHHVRAVDMVRAARQQLDAAGCSDAFVNGQSETVIAWQEGDLWFRSLLDWFDRPTLLYDYKSSAMSVAPHAIPMMMANAGWGIQAAFHERGLDVLDPAGRGRHRFRFVAQENAPPYALTVCELPESVLTIGRKQVNYAVEVWRQCMERGEFPGYPAEIVRPLMPGFKENAWLERELEHDERRRRAPEKMLTDIMGG